MKVNPELNKVPASISDSVTSSKSGSAGASAAASTSRPEPAASSIQISSASIGLQSGDSTDAASFDSAKVDQIKQAITQGRFQVNTHVVADKLIASAQDLVSAASSKGN
ncbi:MAG: flagellar biosynthesis anti-sigma factor FlgM [Burkholderiaceae bacterium]|jgi:negative regulator of flagellin synthesis FlgM